MVDRSARNGNVVKVGIFASIALVVLAYLIVRTEQIDLFGPEGKRIYALFDSVAGLDDGSAVRVAGVRVGRVDGIELDDRRAKVGVLVEEPLGLTEGTTAGVISQGLLGDRYLELVPGPADRPTLSDGAVIPGRSPTSIDSVISSLGNLGQSLEKVTGQLSGETAPTGPLGRLVTNLESTSRQLRELIEANRAQLDATIANMNEVSGTLARELPRLAGQLDGLLSEVRGMMAENRGTVRESLANVEEVTEGLQTSVADLNEISAKVSRGEGTLGKLLSSDEAHEELVATMDSVQSGVDSLSQTLGRAQQLELELALHGYHLEATDDSRGAFQLDLATGKPYRYRLAVVDTPRGTEETTTETVTVTQPDGTSETRTIETVRREDDITFTALFGLPAGDDLRLWSGLMESKFGLGLEYRPSHLEDDLWLQLDAFDFDREENLDPHLRLTAGWQPFEHIFVQGGYDDLLTDDFRSLFLGAGIRWSDDDLKYLLGSLPRF